MQAREIVHRQQRSNFIYFEGKEHAFIHQRNSLHEATRRGDLHTVRRLIGEGTDVNSKDDSGVSIRLFRID